MWWAIPISIIGVVILVAIPMTLEYLAEKKEDKNNDDRNNTNN